MTAQASILTVYKSDQTPDQNSFEGRFPFLTKLESISSDVHNTWRAAEKQIRNVFNENDHLKQEISRLQKEIKNLKRKSCDRCSKLAKRVQDYEREVRSKEEIISALCTAVPKNHRSYDLLTQRVSDSKEATEMLSKTQVPDLIEASVLAVDTDNTTLVKSPETSDETMIEKSPVYQRYRLNNKRRLCLASNKKNRFDEQSTHLNGDFLQSAVVDIGSQQQMTSSTPDNLKDCIVSLDDASPELIDASVQQNPCEPQVRRSLNFNNKPKLNRSTEESKNETKEPALSPLNFNTIRVGGFKSSPENKKREAPVEDVVDNSKQKTKWNLTKSREPVTNNGKLKQTRLSTAIIEGKTDISTLRDFKDIASHASPEKTFQTRGTMNDKENETTIFEPAVTSTANDHLTGHQVTMKTPVKGPEVMENSFDFIPKTSPDYKYKRDAVRKKADRRKLPGQECAKCLNFYNQHRADYGETQAKKIMDKCSRHRDKFSIRSYTPPGLWNPLFTDDES